MQQTQPDAVVNHHRPTRQDTDTKLIYEKPALLVIPLIAEEVLAVGCKLDSGGSGPVGVSCTSAHCSAPGS